MKKTENLAKAREAKRLKDDTNRGLLLAAEYKPENPIITSSRKLKSDDAKRRKKALAQEIAKLTLEQKVKQEKRAKLKSLFEQTKKITLSVIFYEGYDEKKGNLNFALMQRYEKPLEWILIPKYGWQRATSKTVNYISGPAQLLEKYNDKIFANTEMPDRNHPSTRDFPYDQIPKELSDIFRNKIKGVSGSEYIKKKTENEELYNWTLVRIFNGQKYFELKNPDKKTQLTKYSFQNFKVLDHDWLDIPYDIKRGISAIKDINEYDTLLKQSSKSPMAKKNIEYLKSAYIPQECGPTALLSQHKYQMEAYHRNSFEVTYDFLKGEVMKMGKDEPMTLVHLKRFYVKYRIELSVFDMNRNELMHYHPSEDNRLVCDRYGPTHDKYILGDDHLWLITSDIRFSKDYVLKNNMDSTHYNCDFKTTKALPTPTPTSMPTYLKNTIEEVIARQNEKCRIVYQGDIFELYLHFRSLGIIPSKINGSSVGIQQFTLKEMIITRKMVEETDTMFKDMAQFNLHKKMKTELKELLINHRLRSNYNSDLKTLLSPHRANLKCILPNVRLPNDSSTKYVAIDMRRAYCTILEDMPWVGVFNESDEYVVYNNQPILEHNIYLVKVKSQTIFMSDKYIYCFGCNLIQYIEMTEHNTSNFTVLGFMRPSRIEQIDVTDYLTELYKTVFDADNKEKNDKLIKDIVNTTIGNTGRRSISEKSCQIGTLKDMELIRANSTTLGSIYCISSDKCEPWNKLFMFKSNAKKELISGFYTIQAFIYDRMRLILYELYHLIETRCNVTVYGVNTDSVFIKASDVPKVKEVFKHKFDVDETKPLGMLGQWKLEYNKYLPKERMKPLKADKINIHQSILETKMDYIVKTVEFTREQEQDPKCEPIVGYIKSLWAAEYNSAIQINAFGPGMGKSYLCNKLREQFAPEESLFVSPTNALIQQFKNGDLAAVTACGLLNLFPCNGQLHQSKENNKIIKPNLKFVIFDEILLNPILVINQFVTFMKNNPQIKFACTIGATQLQGREKHNTKNLIKYKLRILNRYFPTEVLLKVSQRGNGEICDWMVSSEFAKTSKKDKIKCLNLVYNKFKTVDNLSEIPDDFRFALCHTNAEKEAWIKLMISRHTEANASFGVYRVCKQHKAISVATKKSIEIKNACIYTLKGKTEDGLRVILAQDKLEHTVTLEEFKQFYHIDVAMTIYCSQGSTIDKKYVIFGLNSYYATKALMCVALSRGVSIDNILIYTGRIHSEEYKLQNRIESHIWADKKAGRSVDIENYVDKEWVSEELAKNETCRLCRVLLTADNFSIDRTDNKLCHVKSNCKIICRYCNVAKSDSFI